MDTTPGVPTAKLHDIDQAVNYTTALLRINDLTTNGIKVLLTCYSAYENSILVNNDLQDYRQKTGIYQDYKGYAVAEFVDTDNRKMLVSVTPVQSLEGVEGSAVISEVSALIRSFRACYQHSLDSGEQIAHLHLSPDRFDLFIYENNELIAYTFDIFDNPDEISYLTGLTSQFAGPQARWRHNLNLIVVSGHTEIQALPMANLNWLQEIDTTAKFEIKQFDTSQLYILDEISDLKQKISRHNQALSRTAALVPMVGAILSHQDNYGGDFLHGLNPEIKAVGPTPLELILQVFAKSSRNSNSIQFDNPVINFIAKNMLSLSLVLSLIVGGTMFGIKYQQLSQLDTQLTNQLAIEKKRETDNQKTEALTTHLRQRMETMKKRIEVVNTKKPDQVAPFTIFTSVVGHIPSPTPGNPPITLTELNITGREIQVVGYTRTETLPAATTSTEVPTASTSSPPPTQPTVTYYDESETVRGFVTNLKNDPTFTNVQVGYDNGQKNKFTISLQYTRDIPTIAVEGKPIPEKLIQAAPIQLTKQ